MSVKSKRTKGDVSGGQFRLIHHYEEVARASHSMLDAAYQGDWDQVEALGAQCEALIQNLRQTAPTSSLSHEEQVRRFALLRSILRDDARIRSCSEPWLRNLDQYLR